MKTERLKCGAVIRNTWKSCSKRIASVIRFPSCEGRAKLKSTNLKSKLAEKYKFAPETGRDFVLALVGLSIFVTNVCAEEASAEEK